MEVYYSEIIFVASVTKAILIYYLFLVLLFPENRGGGRHALLYCLLI